MSALISGTQSNEPQAENGDEGPYEIEDVDGVVTSYNQEWCKGTPPLGNHIPQYVMLHEQVVPGVGRVHVGHCPQCGKEFVRYD